MNDLMNTDLILNKKETETEIINNNNKLPHNLKYIYTY